MIALAALFAALAICHFALCCVTGSGTALIAGLIDAAVGLVAFCIWAWSL